MIGHEIKSDWMSRDLKSRVKSQNIVPNKQILINFVMFYQAKSIMNPFESPA